MSEKKGRNNRWSPWGALVRLALIAVAVALAASAYVSLGAEARWVFVGLVCTLGAVGTIIMLMVLVRQSNGRR